MKFADILVPGMEAVRLFKDCSINGRQLRRGERVELPAREAQQIVARGDGGYSTRVELTKPIGPWGQQGVEPGVGSVIEAPSWVALKLEQEGKGRPAKPLDAAPASDFDLEGRVKVRITAPKKCPNNPGYVPGAFIAAIGRYCANGEEPEVPETIAHRLIKAGLAELVPGQSLAPARAGAA